MGLDLLKRGPGAFDLDQYLSAFLAQLTLRSHFA